MESNWAGLSVCNCRHTGKWCGTIKAVGNTDHTRQTWIHMQTPLSPLAGCGPVGDGTSGKVLNWTVRSLNHAYTTTTISHQSLPSGEVLYTFYRCLYGAVINKPEATQVGKTHFPMSGQTESMARSNIRPSDRQPFDLESEPFVKHAPIMVGLKNHDMFLTTNQLSLEEDGATTPSFGLKILLKKGLFIAKLRLLFLIEWWKMSHGRLQEEHTPSPSKRFTSAYGYGEPGNFIFMYRKLHNTFALQWLQTSLIWLYSHLAKKIVGDQWYPPLPHSYIYFLNPP